MTDIVDAKTHSLVDVLTGEFLPATVDNAARVLDAARRMKGRLNDVVADATGFLLAESQRIGTKTLETGHGKVVLTGGASTEYDCLDLMNGLRAAGCPEERISAAVQEEVSYKANRAVLRQLAAANPAYADVIRSAEHEIEKPYRASVRP